MENTVLGEDDRPDNLRGNYICELLYVRFEIFQELQEFQKEVSIFKPGESAGTGVYGSHYRFEPCR